jgi:hypothetical protein
MYVDQWIDNRNLCKAETYLSYGINTLKIKLNIYISYTFGRNLERLGAFSFRVQG